MTDGEKTFIAERFSNEKGTDKEREEYMALSDDLRKVYRDGCKIHPEWSHVQRIRFIFLVYRLRNNTILF